MFIAHEISQPLTAIVANANACSRLLAPLEPGQARITNERLGDVRAALVDIARDGRRASDVVGGMRARLQDGRSERQSVDINRVIEEVLSLAQPDFAWHAVVVSTDLHPDLPPVSGNNVRFQTVVYNLVCNAIEAMETAPDDARRLTIRSRLDESGRVAVTLEDQGPGIARENLERMFDMFVTTKPGHFGLGLWVSRSILQAYGGNIWASAGSAGASEVGFTLPACTLSG